MEETPTTTGSTGTPSTIQRSPLDFADEDIQTVVEEEEQTENPAHVIPPQQIHPATEEATTEVPPETDLEREVTIMGPLVNKRRKKRVRGKEMRMLPPKC